MSQGALQLPTVGPVDPGTYSGDINTVVGALVTKNSGNAAPANFSGAASFGQDWIDTTTAASEPWQVYDGTNWLIAGTLDTTNHVYKTYFAAGTSLTLQTLGASQNNYNPATLSVANRIPITATVPIQITGLAGGLDGRIVVLDVVAGSSIVQLVSLSASSTAANQFDIPVAINISARHSVALFWSTQAAKWRVLGTLASAGPTQQTFTAGAGATYTTPAGCSRIRVRQFGGGGSGAQNSTNAGAGTTGNDTSFGGVTAKGGSAGAVTGVGGAGGTGGAGTLGTFTNRFTGNPGGYANTATGSNTYGGAGGEGPFGGAGAPAGAGATNSGGGGGGQAISTAAATPGGGGGSGEYVEMDVPNPAATYTYTVGAAAAAPAGAGNGAAGLILVEEYYN